ncbi:MAG: Peptidase family [Acidobacteria bacterium]|nr:Peptidase family [Acidobacteriota bacterium]
MQYLGGVVQENTQLSPHTEEVIDSEVRRVVTEQLERAQGLLVQHRTALEHLASQLLQQETVDGSAADNPVAIPRVSVPTPPPSWRPRRRSGSATTR